MSRGAATATASATGGAGGDGGFFQILPPGSGSGGNGGNGGNGTAKATAAATGGSAATATATATGGAGGTAAFAPGINGVDGAGDATASATTSHGAEAQAWRPQPAPSRARNRPPRQVWAGSSLPRRSRPQPRKARRRPNERHRSSGRLPNARQPGAVGLRPRNGVAVEVLLDRAYWRREHGRRYPGPGPGEAVYGTSVLGANLSGDGSATDTYSASSTFDFASKGDLLLGLIAPLDGAPTRFQQIDFTVTLDGAEVVKEAFTSLVTADAFFDDQVINLGAVSASPTLYSHMISSYPCRRYGMDLAFGGAVPEPST